MTFTTIIKNAVLCLAILNFSGCGSGTDSSDPAEEPIIDPVITPPVFVEPTIPSSDCRYNEEAIIVLVEGLTRIEAEDYDTCASSSFDSTDGNSKSQYRQDNVDIDVNTEGSDNYHLTDTVAQEFLEYTLETDKSGLYQLDYRIRASTDKNSVAASFTFMVNDESIVGSTIEIAPSADGLWQTISVGNVYLSDGPQVIQLHVISGGAELDYIELSYQEETVISPFVAIESMQVGINLGNTLDAPDEGDWAPIAQRSYLEAFKDAGFNHVRLPITWGAHVDESAPYAIDEEWIDRTEQVVDWALAQGYIVIMNAHHETWLKGNYDLQTNKDRFSAIWEQVAERFKDKSARLQFEILNEPQDKMTVDNVNEVNTNILKIIRDENPTRIVVFSGTGWTPLDSLLAIAIPNDQYIIGNFHSYDPWKFAGQCINSWGSQQDYDDLEAIYIKADKWSTEHNVPVMVNEFGATKYDQSDSSNVCEKSERLNYLAAHVLFASQRNIAITAWDDNGSFGIYDRLAKSWGEEKDVLVTEND